MSVVAPKQILRAQDETRLSLTEAIELHEKWLAAINDETSNFDKKQVDHTTRAFKNRLLSVKWDCEDLEELINVGGNNFEDFTQLNEVKNFVNECKDHISNFMHQLEEFDGNDIPCLTKHGITLPNPTNSNVPSIIQNPLSRYERLSSGADVDAHEIHFDKNQVETSTTIYNNSLYEHYEIEDRLTKGINASQVFANLTRPSTDVYMTPNENEMILEMLEPEYYSPPSGLLTKREYAFAMRRFSDQFCRTWYPTKFILFVPILIMIFLVI